MNTVRAPLTQLLIAAAIGAVITYGSISFINDAPAKHPQIAALENRISDLETLLSQKDAELNSKKFTDFDGLEQNSAMAGQTDQLVGKVQSQQPESDLKFAKAARQLDQKLKDLLTLAHGDPRTFDQKVNDFLSKNSSKEDVAIASKAVLDLVDNRDVLPDHTLDSIYLDQTDPDFKRVVAQVASLRGDNSLIEEQLTHSKKGLKSTSPIDRQKALVELAKTRYAGAADLVVPLLHDGDIGVKLDALLALRSTGNQSHIAYLADLVNHPNESVSWLAKDVKNNLEMLSDMARTRLVSNDIVAELPANIPR